MGMESTGGYIKDGEDKGLERGTKMCARGESIGTGAL